MTLIYFRFFFIWIDYLLILKYLGMPLFWKGKSLVFRFEYFIMICLCVCLCVCYQSACKKVGAWGFILYYCHCHFYKCRILIITISLFFSCQYDCDRKLPDFFNRNSIQLSSKMFDGVLLLSVATCILIWWSIKCS